MKSLLPGFAILVMAFLTTQALADTTPAAPNAQPAPAEKKDPPKLDTGDTAWMLVSTGLVLLMVPGLALFYGGMVRRKNVLGTMMQSMVALAIVGLQWVLFGYALAFGDTRNGLIGWSWKLVGLREVAPGDLFSSYNIPIYVHCMYQGMFAIITPALISGAIAERIKFGPYCLFILLWSVLVYDPLAHWVWALNAEGKSVGWLGAMGALDFAGGTVVHVAAGVSGLAAILVLRKRIGYPEHAVHPNSMVLTLLGAGLLWFGWFGFNGGSSLHADAVAGSALTASQVAAAAAALSWMLVEWLHRGKPTALGLASGLVAGLVVITPASGFVSPMSALIMGLLAGVICYGAVCLKPILKYDDSLDAFGVHGVGGFVGAILTGVFASKFINDVSDGKPVGFVDGNSQQVLTQFIAAAVAVGYSFVVSAVLIKLIDVTMGFCSEPKLEQEGLDRAEHGETGFDLSPETEFVPVANPQAPRAATTPPDGQRRFTVVVEGAKSGELMSVWSELCQAGAKPQSPAFRTVYPYLTTVQGNRFRFRGGEPSLMRDQLLRVFQDKLDGTPLKTHVET